MSTRVANWVSRTAPGTPPPPPSRAHSTGPPPTIYPESSVSNPDASRYSRRSSRPRSASIGPSHHSSHRSSSHYSARSSSHSHSRTRSGSIDPITPVQTYYAPPQQPIIARTSTENGRTSSYMIIPPKGQRVEILHPTPARAATLPPSSASGSYYSSSGTAKEKPLIKRLFDRVEWGADRSTTSTHRPHSRTGSITVIPPSHASHSHVSHRSRRNSTGSSGAGGWTVVPGASRVGSRISVGSGTSGTQTRVTSASGRAYNIHYV